mmetsp:Transcript_74069/g.197476  ORF Transcript_74069/g.197476 Transcript_74069/m.197476 type:complete len:206 (-) Transcript_74069:1067-1684(-)
MSKSMTPAGPCRATAKGPMKAPAVHPSASADHSDVRTSWDFFSGPSTTVSPCSFRICFARVIKSLDSKCRRSCASARDINASQGPKILKSPMPSAGLTFSIAKASCNFPQSSRLVCSAATCDWAISCSNGSTLGVCGPARTDSSTAYKARYWIAHRKASGTAQDTLPCSARCNAGITPGSSSSKSKWLIPCLLSTLSRDTSQGLK